MERMLVREVGVGGPAAGGRGWAHSLRGGCGGVWTRDSSATSTCSWGRGGKALSPQPGSLAGLIIKLI